ncbi:hypothetical protein L1887_17856 [Cichorium endivia]|nr:hypothetical protein L1887_17856 [Cichorium endivia]
MEVEDDWVPFRPFVSNDESESEDSDDDNSEDDDDAISDTWRKHDRDLEEGEIRQDGDTAAVPAPATGGVDGTTDQRNDTNCPIQCGGESDASSRISTPTGIYEPPVTLHNDIGDNGETNNFVSHVTNIGPGKELSGGCNNIVGSPNNVGGSGSPEFDIGDTAIKRRRIKKKEGKGKPVAFVPQSNFSKHNTGNPSPPSLDLNRDMADSGEVNQGRAVSPTASSSSIAREIEQIKEVGQQVGFQFGDGDSLLAGVANGGGVINNFQ